MEIRKAVVFGANGSIGQEITRQLVNLDIETVVVVREGRAEQIPTSSKVTPMEIDYSRPRQMAKSLLGATEVYFTPADVSQGRARPAAFRRFFPGRAFKVAFETNVLLPLRMKEVAEATGVASLVYLSSMAVYGRQSGLITEANSLKTNGIYGVTKAIAEKNLLCSQKNTEVTVLRPSFVFGPGANTWTELLYQLLSEDKRVVPGEGTGVMPIVDIRDVATSMIEASQSSQVGGSIYNLSADEYFTVGQICQYFQVLTGENSSRITAFQARAVGAAFDGWSLLSGRSVSVTLESINNLMDPKRVISSEKIQRELGVKFRPVRQTLVDSINWLNEIHGLGREGVISKAFGTD